MLPHAGGKIPDTAFETDRLFLNRLQKEGISLPDGIVPEQRNPQASSDNWQLRRHRHITIPLPFQVYQYYSKPMRTVYRIALSSDGRYTPREGRYHYRQVPTVETTYLYPQALGRPYVLLPPKHALPTYRQLQLHNPLLNQVKFQPKKGEQPTAQLRMPHAWLTSLHFTSFYTPSPSLPFAVPNFLELAPSVLGKSGHAPSSAKAQSYQNVNLLHGPALSAFKKTPGGSKTYVDSYGKTHVSAHNNHLSLSRHATTMINTILTIPFNVKNVFLAALQWIWWLDQQTRLESRSTKVVLVFLSKEEDDFYVSYALSIKFSTISIESTTTIKPINAINTSILII